MPAITSPTDGATVATTFVLRFDAPPGCSCDTCGCWDDPPSWVSITVDDEGFGSCDDPTCIANGVELTLAPGDHSIRIMSEFSFHVSQSEPILVHVQDAVAETDTSDALTGGATETGDASPATEDDDAPADASGCGCNTTAPSPAALVLLLTPFALRRRSRPRAASRHERG